MQVTGNTTMDMKKSGSLCLGAWREKEMGRLLTEGPENISFNEGELHTLLPSTARRCFRRDDIIFFQGDRGNSLFIILSGKVKVVSQSDEGKEVILAILGKDEIFGEMALLDGRARCATVIALADTETLVLSEDHFRMLFITIPDFFMKIVRLFLFRIRSANAQIEHLAFCSVKERLIRMLLFWAEERGVKSPAGVSFMLPYNKTEISSLIGTSRESVSRTFRELTDMGLIQIEKREIMIENTAQLLSHSRSDDGKGRKSHCAA